MDLNLKGKVAVVLGSSAGVGYEIASKLASQGCRIAMCARDINRLEIAANKIIKDYGVSVMFRGVDLTDKTQIDSFFCEVYRLFPVVDILINNAGGAKSSDLIELSDEDYHKSFELILMSKIRASSIVIPKMIENKNGKIINIESTSIKNVMPGMGLSNIFRSASNAFIKTLAVETVGSGLHAHTIMLGPFVTNRLKELGEGAAKKMGIDYELWKENAAAATPMGRFGHPEEVGSLVAFLASEKSNYMNGLCIAIDGGAIQSIN